MAVNQVNTPILTAEDPILRVSSTSMRISHAPPVPRRDALLDETLAAIAAHHRAVHDSCMPSWATTTVSVRELTALLYLRAHGSQTIGQLGRRLHASRPMASILIDRLVRLNLVARTEDATDRRRTMVELTAAGMALIAGLVGGTEQRWHDWCEQLNHAELKALIQGLRALTAQMAMTEAAATFMG
jgi:DNA-binding MarR family transcriptional regulator